MRIKKGWIFVLTLCLVLTMSGCGQRGEAVSLLESSTAEETEEDSSIPVLLTHSENTESLTHQMAEMFQKELEEISGGHFSVSIYPENTLGSLNDGVQDFSNGAVEIRLGSGPSQTLQVARWFPLLTGLETDILEESLEEGGALREIAEEECLENQTLILGVFPVEYRLLTSQRSIYTAADIDGLNIRVPNAGYDRFFWQQLGAQCLTFDVEQVSLALQLGFVDSQENTLSSIISNRFYEEQEYVTLIGHKVYFDVLFINSEFFYSLSQKEQEMIRRAAEKTVEYSRETQKSREEEALHLLEENGMQYSVLASGERQKIRELVLLDLLEYLNDGYGEEMVLQVLDCFLSEE